jgi:Domain of unknown function (DUF5666)
MVGDMNKFSGFVRAHLGAAIAAVATAVVFVGGILILTLAGGGGTPAAANANSTTTTLAPPSAGRSGRAGAGQRRQGVRGAITAINGTTWTITSAAGVPVTVDVATTTAFGTKKVPLTASDFAVGDHIVVAGARTGTTVTATRITMAPATGGAPPGGATTTTTTPGG